MSSVKFPTVLVSFAPLSSGAAPWLSYHLGLGVDQIILYQRPASLRQTTDLTAFEEAGHLTRRPLVVDVGPPLKSAMVAAMTQDGLPENAFVLALNMDEYLAFDTDSEPASKQLKSLQSGGSARSMPLISEGKCTDTRTLFHAAAFQSHNGTRPIIAAGDAAPVWCDAAGTPFLPDDVFWGESGAFAANGPVGVVHVSGNAAIASHHPLEVIVASRNSSVTSARTPPVSETAAPDPPPTQSDPVFLNPERDQPDWYREITQGGATTGFFKQLDYQSLVHIKRPSDQLVITFDNLSAVNDVDPNRGPWAYKFLSEIGCAHLGVFAHRKDWYRDPALIEELQSLRDSGLFEGYSDVVFTGTSMGGFAALVFSSLVPGARVLAFSPQSTLDETIVPWETRFGMGRVRNWRLPFSDAAFEIEQAAEVIIISDPYFALDQWHVDRLQTPNVTRLSAWFSGHFSPVFLRRAHLLKPVMQAMIDKTLTPAHFYSLYRARRKLPWYKRAMEDMAVARGHDGLAARVGPAFRRAKRAENGKER